MFAAKVITMVKNAIDMKRVITYNKIYPLKLSSTRWQVYDQLDGQNISSSNTRDSREKALLITKCARVEQKTTSEIIIS